MTGFDLTLEPWIPCVGHDGVRRELGLREVLVGAHELREILDPAPPVTVALHRLALAVLHRIFGPMDRENWARLWRSRRFDPSVVDDYLDTWRDRLDLFHPEFPFYQTPGLDLDGHGLTAAKLVLPLASGNNPTLFDHTTDDREVRLPPGEAARWLVAYQGYAPGGTLTRFPGESPSATAGPLLRGAAVLITGETLFETLLLNLVRYDGSDDAPFAFEPKRDQPAWEAPGPAGPEERAPFGYLDLLTWQSRRILLGADGGFVTRVCIMRGRELPRTWMPAGRETMLAYRANRRGSKGQDPFTPLQFEEERDLWRDSPILLGSARAGSGGLRPKTLDWVAELASAGFLSWESTYRISAAGLVARRAKMRFWRHDRLPLPLAVLDEGRGLVDYVEEAVAVAERAGEALASAAQRFAWYILPEGMKREELSAVVARLGPGRDYWPALDPGFRRFLFRLGGAGAGEANGLLREWADEVRSAAGQAFDAMRRRAGTGARALRAAAKAERVFLHALGGMLAPYQGEVVAGGDGPTVG